MGLKWGVGSDIRADMVEAEQLLDALRKMFSDSNPVVVSNAVAALAEISDASGTNLLKQFFGTHAHGAADVASH